MLAPLQTRHGAVVAHVVQRHRRQPPPLHERLRRRLAVERVPAGVAVIRLNAALACTTWNCRIMRCACPCKLTRIMRVSS